MSESQKGYWFIFSLKMTFSVIWKSTLDVSYNISWEGKGLSLKPWNKAVYLFQNHNGTAL